MWECFLFQYNGITKFLQDEPTTQESLGIQVASNDVGWVAIMQTSWIQGTWGSMFSGKLAHLLKSMVPWLAIMVTFGYKFTNSPVTFISDHLQAIPQLSET